MTRRQQLAAPRGPEVPGGSWEILVDYARRAPSPHNTQPARLRILDDRRAELYFARDRGLPVGDPRGRFTQTTFGIFVEILSIAAHARGWELETDYTFEPPQRGTGELRKVADLRLTDRGRPVPDLDPELILRRRTNRHPYDDRTVPRAVIEQLQDEAARFGHRFAVSTEPQAIRWVKELNRDALTRDLSSDRYREELKSWVRYSADEALRQRDGLSPEALAMPGWLLRAVMEHPWILSTSGLRRMTQRLYMATMRGISTVGWIQGDYATVEDWTRAGHLMIRLWLMLTAHGLYWQPYGSVITDERARRSMVDRFDLREGEDGRDMAWLLVRLGHSDHEPARSHRLPREEVLL